MVEGRLVDKVVGVVVGVGVVVQVGGSYMTTADKQEGKEVVEEQLSQGHQEVLGGRLVQLVQLDHCIRWVLLVLTFLGHQANQVVLRDLVGLELVVAVVVVEEEAVGHKELALVVGLHSTSVNSQGHNQHRIHHRRRIVFGLKTQIK